MQWVLLLALSNGGVAILDADNRQHCEEIEPTFSRKILLAMVCRNFMQPPMGLSGPYAPLDRCKSI